MRIALIASLFLLSTSLPAFAVEEHNSYQAGHFAGEIDGGGQGMVKPVDPPASTSGGGLGTRTLKTATPVPVAPASLPPNALRPKSPLAAPQTPAAGNNGNASQESIDDIRRRLEDKAKDAESEDKMGNFEVQDLMNKQNQSETLGSHVQKKLDDTRSTTTNNLK